MTSEGGRERTSEVQQEWVSDRSRESVSGTVVQEGRGEWGRASERVSQR